MRYIDVINDILSIESLLNIESVKYGLYSVDRHLYFHEFVPSTHDEVSIKHNPYRLDYIKPNVIDIKDYLLKHDGRLYYPALQKNCRHGIMLEFDVALVYHSNIGPYIQEPSGQLCFVL